MDEMKAPSATTSKDADKALRTMPPAAHPQHGPGHDSGSMRDLCLAVLAAVGLLLLVVTVEKHTYRGSSEEGLRHLVRGSPAVASLPPPDLQLLCISRT